jgi:hypothetical protein
LLIFMDNLFKEISKLSAKESWKSFLAIKTFSRNVVPRIHHYFQVCLMHVKLSTSRWAMKVLSICTLICTFITCLLVHIYQKRKICVWRSIYKRNVKSRTCSLTEACYRCRVLAYAATFYTLYSVFQEEQVAREVDDNFWYLLPSWCVLSDIWSCLDLPRSF